MLAWLALALLATGAEPFLHLREATLGYHGPSADFTNLTELRIGWFGPTNLDDPLTGDLWWAAGFAVREANAAGTERGRRSTEPDAPHSALPFRLIPRWAVDPWGTGVSQLARMVYGEQPLALIGSIDSASTHLAEQIAAKANLPLVSPLATDPSVTLAGVAWMFACAPSDTTIARLLVDEILAALAQTGAKEFPIPKPEATIATGLPGLTSPPASKLPGRLALLAGTDHESRMTTRAVRHELSRRGRGPDFHVDVPPGELDLSRPMDRLATLSPTVVLIIAGVEDSARLVQAVRARSHQPLSSCIVFGTPSMGRARFRELAGPAAEGVRFPRLLAADPADPRLARFAERFQAERGRTPDDAAVMTYDAACLLIEAIRRAGPNRARIRDALSQLSPWLGIAGPIAFDGTGQNTRAVVGLGTIRQGMLVPLPSVPSQNATPRNLSRL